MEADRRSLKADGADLSFLTVSLRDKDGRENLQAVKEVTVQVEGAETLRGFGSADPRCWEATRIPLGKPTTAM